MIVDYYVDSDHFFRSNVSYFLDLFGHTGHCFTENGPTLKYSSELANDIREKEKENEGYFFTPKPHWLYSYFDGTYDNEQLFAVVFGAWCGLPHEYCRLIGNKRQQRISWWLLHAFLCGASKEQVSSLLKLPTKNIVERWELFEQIKYPGKYLIDCGDHIVYATRSQNYLIGEDGKQYQIDCF